MDFEPLVDISEPDKIIETFNKYGVVAVTNVLTPTECMETFNDMGLPKKCDINDITTYNLANKHMNRYGVIGDRPLFTKTLLRNRCHKNVRYVFSLLYNSNNIVVQHDRVAWMRPTIDHPEWDTPFEYPGLHVDVNPQVFTIPEGEKLVKKFMSNLTYKDSDDFIAENNTWHHTMGRHLQGIINLFDNQEEDGGFQCVPMEDCVDWLKNWTINKKWRNPPEVNGRHIFTADEMYLPSYRVPCPAGTMVVFDGALPHGTKQNKSHNSRSIQFIRYIPTAAIGNIDARNKLVKQMISQCGFVPTNEQYTALFCNKL